ncbi:hypothetical protein OF83DRAFT_1143601 [Amylostereum chailletii]|nr:hypothetical protein OF83DRAFT_1143601 [Amylostereum chailletii]
MMQSPHAFLGDDEKSVSDNELLVCILVRRTPKGARVTRGNARYNLPQGLLRRKLRRPRMLAEMPGGVLFEIFGYLRPADMFHVSQVSMGFQRLLVSPKAEAIWKSSYMNDPDTPACPEDVTHICWANVLFGSSACYECGSKSGVKILFTLRRRLCMRCMDKTLVSASAIRIPDSCFCFEWESITCSDVIPSAHNTSAKRTTYYFPPEEIDKFFSEVNELIQQACGDPHTLNGEFAKFIAKKRDAVAERNEHGKRCVQWEQDMVEVRRLELQQAKEFRRKQIRERFITMGYDERDLAAIQDHREMNTPAYLTDDIWNTISGELITFVSQRRDLRVATEKRSRRAARERALEEEYVRHWKTLPHSLVSYMPSVHHYKNEFQSIVEMLAEDEPVSDAWRARLRKAIRDTMGTIRDTLRAHKEHLISLLPPVDVPVGGMVSEATRADLATSVFTPARQETNYFGTEILARIFRDWKYMTPPAVHLQERGAQTVRHLLALTGLGEDTAKVDMDRKDARFVCLRCPAARRNDWTLDKSVVGRFVMGWRTAVDHMVSMHPEGEPHMRVLTEGETESIRMQEEKLRSVPTKRIYGCCHCTVHIGTSERSPWLNYTEMTEHLGSEHSVEKGVEEVDFFYDPRTWRVVGSNGEVVLPMDP